MEMAQTTSATTRSVAIDATRTVMNTLIVLHHSGWPFMAVAMGVFEGLIVKIIGRVTWTLPALFCLSGYLMMRGYTWATVRHKYWSRFKRLAAPLLLVNWAILPVIGIGLLTGFVTNPKYDIEWAVRSLFLLKEGTTLATLWYVRTLLIFTIISPFLYWGLRSKLRQIILLLFTGIWCIASTLLNLDEMLWKIIPSFSILCFLIGGTLAMNGFEICAFARRWWLPICMCYIIGVSFGVFQLNSVPYQNGLVCGLPCLFWFVFAEKFSRLMKYHIVQYLCECAFFVFAIHSDMVYLIPKKIICWIYAVVPAAYLSWPGEMVCAMLFVATINLVICVSLYAILKRFMPLVARIMNGRL